LVNVLGTSTTVRGASTQIQGLIFQQDYCTQVQYNFNVLGISLLVISTFREPDFIRKMSTFRDWFWPIEIRPHGWRVSYPNSVVISQITLNSAKLSVLLTEVNYFDS